MTKINASKKNQKKKRTNVNETLKPKFSTLGEPIVLNKKYI